MMNKIFIDTNLAIAFVYYINSLHLKSLKVFEFNSEIYWSNYVKSEFNRRFNKKYDNLIEFFNDLRKYLENPEQEFYSPIDLKEFAKKRYEDKKQNDTLSSINPFWDKYIRIESQISFLNMKKSITSCLKDLTYDTFLNKQKLENNLKLTLERTNNYSKIDEMLKLEGVSKEDRHVTLDGHDFACYNSEPVDFVTFDDDCCNGAKNVEILCFNSIKGKYDLKT